MFRRRTRPSSKNPRSGGERPAVGTEAAARENMEKNRVNFNYPEEGFVHKVEHSLIYAMLKEPSVYPRSVLMKHIAEEDFSVYLAVNDKKLGHEDRASYGQLCALLAISAENYPPRDVDNVSDALAKAVLRIVLRYAEEHGLDRETELKELLQPVRKYAENRNAKAEMRGVLSLYAGYAASLVTANPVPFVVGLAVYTSKVNEHGQEMENVNSIRDEARRRADVETAGLLDETDDF